MGIICIQSRQVPDSLVTQFYFEEKEKTGPLAGYQVGDEITILVEMPHLMHPYLKNVNEWGVRTVPVYAPIEKVERYNMAILFKVIKREHAFAVLAGFTEKIVELTHLVVVEAVSDQVEGILIWALRGNKPNEF